MKWVGQSFISILENLKKYSTTTVLIGILIYFCYNYIQHIETIEKVLHEIQIELVEIKVKFASHDEVNSKIEKAIENHVKLFHSK